jgi:exonuclease VII small subunit
MTDDAMPSEGAEATLPIDLHELGHLLLAEAARRLGLAEQRLLDLLDEVEDAAGEEAAERPAKDGPQRLP